ncbi:MAG: hypothetical protein K9N47_06875 [Prosthecobacter sp.]|nr:hypothetical protein [Prosthecobacter sp.]
MPQSPVAASPPPEDLLLAEAVQVCRGTAGDDRAESGSQADPDSQRRRQIAALEHWASRKGLLIDHLVPDEVDDSRTREHHIFFHPADPSRIYKITKGPGWGIFPASLATTRHKPVRYWFEDRPATPLEYFERTLLSNTHLMHELNRDDYPVLNRLEGFVHSHGQLQAITSQPVFDGSPATPSMMASWFIKRGFCFIRSWAWFRPADGLAVFDAYMDNVMDCDDELVPFDVIPILAKGPLLESLHAAVARLDSQSHLPDPS